MPGRATVDGAIADLLSHMWRHIMLPQFLHEGPHVVALVGTQSDPSSARDVSQDLDRSFPFRFPGRVGQSGTDGQAVPVLHHHMAHEVELGFLASLGHESRIRIRRRLVRVVASLLPVEVHGRIAGIIRGNLSVRSVLTLEALQARPGLYQRPVHREMLVGGQTTLPSLGQHLLKKQDGDVAPQQTVPVLGEHRRIPDVVVHRQADKPTEEQVVVQLLHQHPLATNGVQDLQEQCSKQPLGRNRRPPGVRVKLFKVRPQPAKDVVHHRPDRSQRMVLGHPLRRRNVAKHGVRLAVVTAHSLLRARFATEGTIMTGHIRPFSAAC
jgi:hypothetical protein